MSEVVDAKTPSIGRGSLMALGFAVVYSTAFVVACFLVPVYQSQTSAGYVSTSSSTLVGVNGLGAALIAGIPLLITIAVACALRLRLRVGVVLIAWVPTGLLALLNFAAMFSIGIFVLPVSAALFLACALSQAQAAHTNTLTNPAKTA